MLELCHTVVLLLTLNSVTQVMHLAQCITCKYHQGADLEESIQSLDWTGGLDWWTGDLREKCSRFVLKINKSYCCMYYSTTSTMWGILWD